MVNYLRKNIHLVIIIVLSFLPIIPYFTTTNLIHTHDGLVHIPRLAAYYRALMDGDFPVRFAGFLNYGYGLPLFNFIYQFPYWVGSFFIFLGFGLVNAFKISITLSFILSGFFMFLFAQALFDDKRKAFLVAVVYQFAPFRMVELLVRGSYGEVYTYAFLPLVLYGLVLLSKKFNIKHFLITSIATFLLIVSHNSVSLLFFGAAFLFVFFQNTNLKKIIFSLISLFYGLVLASFYWVPAILEHKYTYGDLFMKDVFRDNFPSFLNFFIPNFNNNPQFQTGGITTFIGLVQLLSIAGALFVLLKKNKQKNKRIYFFALLVFVLSFIFMLPFSEPIWSSSVGSFLRQFQFPWRFLSIMVLSCAILSESFFQIFRLTKIRLSVLVFIALISVAFFWKGSEGYDKINEKYYWNFPLNTTYYGETDVIWSAGPQKSYPKQRVEVISGNGNFSNFTIRNSFQKFDVKANDNIQIVSRTTYFPGWTVKVDGKKTPIQFQDPNYRGLLVFDIPKGQHEVIIKFEESKIRLLADAISVLGLLLLFPTAFIVRKYI